MATPKVSIIMSVYNGESYLSEAIESILNQTLSNYEFIIINDGSTDYTGEILREYKHKKIILIENHKNIGLTKSLNKGLSIAKGEYIARMDADDISLPDRLEKQAAFLDGNEHIKIIGCWFDEIDIHGQKIRTNKAKTSTVLIRWRLLFGNAFGHSTIMFRKNGHGSPLYDESFKYGQDYELWSRLCWKWNGANIPEVLVQWRVNDNSISSKRKEAHKNIREIISRNNLAMILGEISYNDLSDFHSFYGSSGKNISLEDLIRITKKINRLKLYFLAKFKFKKKERNILDSEIVTQTINLLISSHETITKKIFFLVKWLISIRPNIFHVVNGYFLR